MDDKVLAALYATLAQVNLAVEEMLRALEVTGAVTPEGSSPLQKIQTNRELREAASKEYMSGRWVRRDGDAYAATPGTLPKPTMVVNADRKAGDL